MKRTLVALVILLMVPSSAALAGSIDEASGEKGAPARLSAEVIDGVLWVSSDYAVDPGGFSIQIFGPKKVRGALLQSCQFRGSGPGEYRCGIDLSVDPKLARSGGFWSATTVEELAVTTRLSFRT